jgi:hypothetical protein
MTGDLLHLWIQREHASWLEEVAAVPAPAQRTEAGPLPAYLGHRTGTGVGS